VAGPEAQLRRSLSQVETTLAGVGIILGAGVYALIGAVADEAGNALWLSFAFAAVVAAVIGLCYAEMASMFPRAGADHEYTRQALGDRPAFVVGWLMVIGNIIGAATVALGFGGYLASLIDADPTLLALIALGAATVVAFVGVEETVKVTIFGTLIEVAGLVLVIAVGIPHFGNTDLLAVKGGLEGVLGGAALVTFAYLGFSQIATLAEEAEAATTTIPRAMVSSIALTSLLYVLVAIAAVSVLGAQALAASDAPLAAVAQEALGGRASDVVAVIALFSTANTMLLLLVAASRMMYGMASTAALPRFLAWVDPRRRTPVRAIALALLLAWAFALTGELAFVAGATNFAIYVGFAAICISLVVLRRKRPNLARPFRVPLSLGRVPLLPLVGLVLVIVQIANLSLDALALGATLLVSGLVAMEALALWRPHEAPND